MSGSDRWEYGSEFAWPSAAWRSAAWPAASDEPSSQPWREARWYATGRGALVALLAHGQATRGWSRLWLPSYFCPEVVAALAATGLRLVEYPHQPRQAQADVARLAVAPGDVVLLVNLFGLQVAPSAVPPGVDVIEDHTHDPWSPWAAASQASYAVASLRKTLPVPDGAVLWSPRQAALPSPPAGPGPGGKKLAAMVLKALYLADGDIAKDLYRRLAVEGEAELSRGGATVASWLTPLVVGAYPVAAWRRARRDNHAALAEALPPEVELLGPATAEACPFTGVVVFASEARRDAVRGGLIGRRLYPAIHWLLGDSAPPAERELSRRSLSLPCDARYGPDDMAKVATVVGELLA